MFSFFGVVWFVSFVDGFGFLVEIFWLVCWLCLLIRKGSGGRYLFVWFISYVVDVGVVLSVFCYEL